MTSERFRAAVELARTLNLTDPEATLEELRARIEAAGAVIRVPGGVGVEAVDAGGVRAEWVRATHASTDHVVAYLHGGGYVMGSPKSHRALAARLSLRLGASVLVLDYRLAPEHPHPAAVSDSTAAVRWLVRQGIASERIAVAGDSGGGGLALTTLLKLRDDDGPMPAAGVAISPWTDLALTGETLRSMASADPMVKPAGLVRFAEWFVGPGDRTAPTVSPLYGDPAGLPPILIHVGSEEVLLDDAKRFADRARSAGVDVTLEVWPDMIHVWHTFAGVPEAEAGVARIAEFLRRNLGL